MIRRIKSRVSLKLGGSRGMLPWGNFGKSIIANLAGVMFFCESFIFWNGSFGKKIKGLKPPLPPHPPHPPSPSLCMVPVITDSVIATVSGRSAKAWERAAESLEEQPRTCGHGPGWCWSFMGNILYMIIQVDSNVWYNKVDSFQKQSKHHQV